MRAIPVVNHIIRMGNREKADLTPMKVQKLLFFMQGWYLAVTGEPLIDEDFEAWQYGPVVPAIYEALKRYGSQPVGDYISDWDDSTGTAQVKFVNIQTRPKFKEILEKVWSEYSHFSATQLSTLTHQRNTPWSKTAHRSCIRKELIKDFFLAQVASNRAAIS